MSAQRQSPWEVLGVSPDANPEALRAAYLAKLREHPPESSPEQFERIRDAYETLRNPRVRMEQMLAANPLDPLVSLLDQQQTVRTFAGPKPWLAVLKEGVRKK